MSEVGLQQLDDIPKITATDQVIKIWRDVPCPFCGNDYGYRKVIIARDGWIVHSRCLDKYNQFVQTRERAERVAMEEAKQAAVRAKHEANIERRGTDMSVWCGKIMDDYLGRRDELSKEERDEHMFFDNVQRELERANEVLEQFVKDIQRDPVYALEWGMKAFSAAAKYKVHSQIKYWFENGLSVAEIKEILEQETFRGSRSPARSTSPSSNLMEQEILAVYSNVCKPWC